MSLGDIVFYKNIKCMVTNTFAHAGKKIIISPVGNCDSPAKYFTVDPDDVVQCPQLNEGDSVKIFIDGSYHFGRLLEIKNFPSENETCHIKARITDLDGWHTITKFDLI